MKFFILPDGEGELLQELSSVILYSTETITSSAASQMPFDKLNNSERMESEQDDSQISFRMLLMRSGLASVLSGGIT